MKFIESEDFKNHYTLFSMKPAREALEEITPESGKKDSEAQSSSPIQKHSETQSPIEETLT